MANSERKEMITPTLVLFIICLVVTGALALTYQVTKPIIEEINIRNANIARGEVLPQGEGSFSQINTELTEGVLEVYQADNKAGYVYTVRDKGFGGKMTIMVGISDKGEIAGVKVTAHTETPGLGTKAMTKDYLSQYLGKASVTRTNEGDKTQIDAVTGATISSNAVFRGVEASLAQFKEMGGSR